MHSYSWSWVGILLISIPGAFLCAQEPTPTTEESAREYVFAFENKLAKTPEENQQERIRLTREFFASLKDPLVKIAAIGSWDDRYVYVVPKSLAGELLGPLLKDQDARVRMRALHALAHVGAGGQYGDLLLEMVKSPDLEIKKAVLSAMANPGNKRFLPKIEEYLRHADAGVRIQAGHSLSAWPEARSDPKTRVLLYSLIDDPSPQVRANLVFTLIFLDPKQAIPRVEKLLQDPNELVRIRAVQALGGAGSKNSAPLIAQRLRDDDPKVRYEAARALGQLKAIEFADGVAKLLDEEDVVVRRFAVKALAEMGAKNKLSRLQLMLEDKDDGVRELTLEALASLGDKTLAPVLAARLDDPAAGVRDHAVQALVMLDCAHFAAQIGLRLDDSSVNVRLSAIRALARFRAQAFADRLRVIAEKDPAPYVRETARDALIEVSKPR